ncbi:MAG: hypothetical protein GF383_08635 [Candidatus Lokiarchaeota archaeon]|nr:hypothetical protein [Candidatus Lokiarchaeota archaeon]
MKKICFEFNDKRYRQLKETKAQWEKDLGEKFTVSEFLKGLISLYIDDYLDETYAIHINDPEQSKLTKFIP